MGKFTTNFTANIKEYVSFAAMRLLLLSFWFTVISFIWLPAQPLPFYAGEKIKMDVYYHWGPIWLKAALVEFKTDTLTWNGELTWKFTATGKTLPSYDWFFKVRDYYEAIVSNNSFIPTKAIRNTQEGNYRVYNEYIFTDKGHSLTMETKTSKRPWKKETISSKQVVFDLLSGAFYARTFQYHLMKPGTKIPVNVAIDNQIYELYYIYEGSDVVEMKDGRKVKALRFSAPTVEGSVFKGHEIIQVWVSADGKNIPLKARAEIIIGSVEAFLTSGY